jgi:ribose transport system substrate-binding protein
VSPGRGAALVRHVVSGPGHGRPGRTAPPAGPAGTEEVTSVSRIRIATLATVAVVALAGCSSAAPATQAPASQAPASQAPASQGAEGAVIGFSQANGGDEWRTNQNNNVRDYCKEYNPTAETLISDAQGDDATQSGHIDEFISRPVNVLLLTPNTDVGLNEAAKRAMAANIPVITLDRQVIDPVTQHIGADNKLIGRTAAEYVSGTILGGNGGKVIEIQGTQGSSATTDRHDEFVKWLEENNPSVEIVTSVDGDYKREKALTAMNDLLQKYGPGEVDVIYTHNDAMALGVVAALETAGRLDEFKVVGIDGQNEAIQAIADGKIVVTFTYDNAGKEACESASKLLAGETIEPSWVLPTNTIDASNAADWVGKGF